MSAEAPYYSKDFATLVQDLLGHLQSPGGGRTALTDITEGSVARTLVEAFARELAVCYEQLHLVYRYGYLDTAAGVALDNVVALLGVSRRRAGHSEGNVTFSRQQPAPEDIPIPAGTLVAGRDIPLFETVGAVLLRKDDRETLVAVRSVEPSGETVKVGAGKITVMPRPILGIETVTNPAELILRQREESDEELRERTRHALQRANRGTPAALEQAVKSLGIVQVTVREEKPGQVEVILGDLNISEDLLQQAKEEVEKARPAGIQVTVQTTTPIWIQINAIVELDDNYPDSRKKLIQNSIEQALLPYFSGLKIGAPVRWAKVQTILTSPTEVIQLHSMHDRHYLEPYRGTPGQLQNKASDYVTINNDIRIGATERAILDVRVLPLRLSLEQLKLGKITVTRDDRV